MATTMTYRGQRYPLLQMNILKFSQALEQHIQDEIQAAYPENWEEDYITRRLAVAVSKLAYTQIEVRNTFNNILIKAFKLKGRNEYKFGDLAIILDIVFKDGDELKGIAYLEAKKRYTDTNKYTALDFSQLERIYSNAPNARLLLYNYQPMSAIAPTDLDTKHEVGGLLPKMPVTFTSVTNLNTAIRLKIKNDRLHKIGIPFSYQFSFRYLYGKDLEFDDDKIKSAQGFLNNLQGKDEIRRPTYTVVVAIRPGSKKEKDIQVFQPEMNRDLYAEVTGTDNF